jgi:hypothetical protein
MLCKISPVTYLINPTVKYLNLKLKRTLRYWKAMDFKPNVLAALETICTPFQNEWIVW